MPSSRFIGAAHRASGAVATNTRGGGREASQEIETSRRRTTLDRPEAGGRSADPPRATEQPITAPDGSRLHALDSAAVRLIVHLATDENGSRGRMGSAKKYLDQLPNMTLEERRALAGLNDDEAARLASVAEKYAKSIGARGRYGVPVGAGAGALEELGNYGKPGAGGPFDGGPGRLGGLGRGSPMDPTGRGGPDVAGLLGGGQGPGFNLSGNPYLGGKGGRGDSGGVRDPRLGGGPDLGSLGGIGGGPGLEIPEGVKDPWRGSPDDGTFGYGTGVSTAQLPNSAWKALHPGGQVSEDPKKPPPPPPPKDEKKGTVDPNVVISKANTKQAPTERPDDRITAAAIGGGVAGAVIALERGGPAAIPTGFVLGAVGGVAVTYLSWRIRGFRPSDDDTGTGPGGPRARVSNQARSDDVFMPAPDDPGPVGPSARTREPGSTFRPADDGSGPVGPVGPRSNTAAAYRDRGGFFLPNPDDPNGPSSPRA